MTQHPEYTFHRGIPVLVPSPDQTPIHDALKREYAEAAVKAAATDPEGIALVEAIHGSKYGSVIVTDPAPAGKLPFLGFFR